MEKIIKEECTIAVCGPVDAGKSSLIGVLTSGELDDGDGSSRKKILKHQHERETGRTSHITFNPLVYHKKDDNTIILYKPEINKNLKDIKIRNKIMWDNKITSFIDLAGHDKYLKTTIFGVTGMFPDYDSFSQVMNQCTENYECLVIDNTTKSNKLEDQVYWFKADVLPKFRVCSPEYWAHAATYSRNKDRDEDDDFDPTTGGARRRFHLNVKRS